MFKRLLAIAFLVGFTAPALAQFATIGPTPPAADNGDRIATTGWVNNFVNGGLPLASGTIWIGSAGGLATAQTMSGDCTLVASGAITCTHAASSLTGTLQAAQEPAHTGDMTNTAGSLATTVTGINGVNQNAAWTTYTPTITAQTGTITTSSATGRYKQIGKTTLLEVDVTITTAGTGAQGLRASLPFTAAAFSYVGSCRDIALSGKSGASAISSGGTTVDMRDATGATMIASGAEVVTIIVYEVP
jgi:hypothetical protein